MNEYLSGFILGFMQGLTEFLPVSSSGHLALLERLGVGEENLFFNLALHMASLLAVIIALREPLWRLIKNPLSDKAKFILIASAPTAGMAAIIRFLLPDTVAFLPFCFISTSVILLLPNIFKAKERSFSGRGAVKSALITGVFQGLACFNGISRSGSTICAMSLCGFSPEDSAETSFLLSIPIIIGSSAVELLTGGGGSINGGSLLVGALTAFVVGLFAVHACMKIVKKRKLWIFSIYTFLMGIASFLLLYI